MQLIELLIIELMFIAISIRWFQGDHIIFGHDSSISLTPIHDLISYIYSWNPQINFGTNWSIINTKAFLFLKGPETLFYLLSSNIHVSQFMNCMFWLSVMGLAIYAYLREVFPSRKHWFIRLFSTIFFVINFYILQAWFIVERAKFSLYAALPLGLLLIRKMLSQKKFEWKYPIYFGALLLLLNGGGEPPLFGSIVLAFPLYALCYIALSSTYRKVDIQLVSKYVLSAVAIAILLNAYYLLPYARELINFVGTAIAQRGGTKSFIAWESAISRNASLVNLFRLQGIPDWYDNYAHPYANQYILKRSLIFLSFLPILIILSGLYLSRWKKHFEKEQIIDIHILLLLLCVGLIFAGGTHPPFGQLYLYAMEHIPGFIVFRSSFYKFAPLVWLPVAVLTGIFLTVFMEYIHNSKAQLCVGVLLCASLLLYHYPYFSTTAFNFRLEFSTRLKIPGYATQMAAKIQKLVPPEGRVLLYPPLDAGYIGSPLDTYQWGYYSLDPLPRMISERTIVTNDSYGLLRITDGIQQALHDGNSETFQSLATIGGITHVLWRGDVKRSEAMDRDIPLSEMDKRLSTMPALSKQVSEGPWTLYKVAASVRPMIYLANHVVYTDKEASESVSLLMSLPSDSVLLKGKNTNVFSDNLNGQELPAISFKELNPTKYTAGVTKSSEKPYVLVFNQQFDAGWVATAYKTNGESMVLKQHLEANSFANAWIVDQTGIGRIELEYMPQRYFYYGLVVSGLTIIGILGYLIYNRKKNQSS